MVAVIFTKPLQVIIFQKIRNEIKVDPATVSLRDHRNVLGNMEAKVQDTDGEWIKVRYSTKREKQRSHVASEGIGMDQSVSMNILYI